MYYLCKFEFHCHICRLGIDLKALEFFLYCFGVFSRCESQERHRALDLAIWSNHAQVAMWSETELGLGSLTILWRAIRGRF